MRFVTLYPETENIHLTKDVGMIPYIMHKHLNYDATLVCYKNGTYPDLETEVSGLKLEFLTKYTGNSFLDGLLYLARNARRIDVLHVYHLKRSLLWIVFYKLLNSKGKAYLKLDTGGLIKKVRYDKTKWSVSVGNVNFRILMKLLKQCDVISTETQQLKDFLKREWTVDVAYIPNGFYDGGKRRNINCDSKQNVICTVGRIGTKQKATEVLMEGFRLVQESLRAWTLRIVGPVEDEFQAYMDEFFRQNEVLKGRVIFTGQITDKKVLNAEYMRAKVFCLTSRFESFGLVFTEAMKNGCFIITSDVETAQDVTHHGEYGEIVPIDDVEALAKCFVKVCNNETRLKQVCSQIQEFAYQNFYWVDICRKIDELLT